MANQRAQTISLPNRPSLPRPGDTRAVTSGTGDAAISSADIKVIHKRMRKEAPAVARAAIARLEQIPWFAALSADVRSWVGVVVQTGVGGFIGWLENPSGTPQPTSAPFEAVPAAAARAVTLEQTVELIRISVDVACEVVPTLAPPGKEDWLRASVERYAREIGFAAALVYARVAEQRGAWDARLQAQLVDALIDGADERTIDARVSALGWPSDLQVRALAVNPPSRAEDLLADVQAAARREGMPILAVAQAGSVLIVMGASAADDPGTLAAAVLPGSDGVVVGPLAPSLAEAAPSVHAALAGLAALAARPFEDGPIEADDLLAERALAGDLMARAALERCYTSLSEAGGGLLDTADAIIGAGGALEPAARRIPIHVNTLRYRLDRIALVTGLDLRDPQQRFTMHVALILGRTRTIATVL